MSSANEEILGLIARLSERERHDLMVELARRYGVPDPGVVGGQPLAGVGDLLQV